ncbi:pyridoxine 5'-phosphate synthase [Candidatus Marinamargulisbacteria bacterium SCGC AAA071-K20]|nr:pyridoxine 5'-phosphate synthase [Candidatus Marinamargulisbacteria bacterium SCGC AAA071-K20]
MATRLSINVNKFALIRNSRGENMPDLLDISRKCIEYGSKGITVHPRPDERHVRYSDLEPLRKLTSEYEDIEFNIEGYPSDDFLKKVVEVKPDQVTFVPDPPDALTSSFGWDLEVNKMFLTKICRECRENDIRSSLFISPELKGLEYLNHIGADRVELYTYDYARYYKIDPASAITPYKQVVDYLKANCNVSINAGHDLSQENLAYLLSELKFIDEVSIGHALVCDSLIDGLEKTVTSYSDLV